MDSTRLWQVQTRFRTDYAGNSENVLRVPKGTGLTFRFLFAYAVNARLRKAGCHELTHSNGKRGAANSSQSLGLMRPGFERLLRLFLDAQALALLPSTTTLC